MDVTSEEQERWSKEEIAEEVGRARKRIKNLVRKVESGSSVSAYPCEEIASELYRMRNAVLAHPSVYTGANLFEAIVPAFETLTATLALAGWARHTRRTLKEAENLVRDGDE